MSSFCVIVRDRNSISGKYGAVLQCELGQIDGFTSTYSLFSSLSYDRSKACSKASCPNSEI